MTADVDIQLNSTDVAKAHSIIIGAIHKTQILTSTSVNSLTIPRLSIFFKAEVFQKTGAFKFRGASHALSCLPPSSLVNGVVTHSSGNHGAALSLAAQERGVKCHVVMPANASRAKIAATKGYGAEISFVENPSQGAKVAQEIARRLKATVVHPYDHKDIVLGQGTVMHEFLHQMREEHGKTLDAVVVPVGGGGLLAGCALACINSGVKVFGAEPAIADDCARGLRQGFKERVLSSSDTIADGLRSEVGDLPFRIIQNHVDRVFTVTEEQIARSMKIIIERLKVVVEPSSAVAVAVVLFHEEFRGIVKEAGIRNVGIVLEGGNIDTESYEKMMPWIRNSG